MSEYQLIYVRDGVRIEIIVEAASAAAAALQAPPDAEVQCVKFLRRLTHGCRQLLPRRL